MSVVIRKSAAHGQRSILEALWRGGRGRCPACGTGRMFDRYLKVAHACADCGEELHHHRADDAPPYFTIFVVGHVVVPPIMWVEMASQPPLWLYGVTALPLTVVLAMAALAPIKGALVGLQWALRMHGFGEDKEPDGAPGPARSS